MFSNGICLEALAPPSSMDGAIMLLDADKEKLSNREEWVSFKDSLSDTRDRLSLSLSSELARGGSLDVPTLNDINISMEKWESFKDSLSDTRVRLSLRSNVTRGGGIHVLIPEYFETSRIDDTRTDHAIRKHHIRKHTTESSMEDGEDAGGMDYLYYLFSQH